MTNEHLQLILMVLEQIPLVAVLGVLAYTALWLVSDRRNKNEWDVQNVYLESQMRKRYKLANKHLTVSLEDQGDSSRINRNETIS